MLRTIIVDDEDLARSVVREHLAAHRDIQVVAECSNGFEAVKAVAELSPDILFLDVQMPKLDGFEVIELMDPKPAVVFVTAYDSYALKAFEVHAVDYLLKPFSGERFTEALEHARARIAAPLPAGLTAFLSRMAPVSLSFRRNQSTISKRRMITSRFIPAGNGI
jgi:two-component system LytT family response regulator